MNDSYLFNFAFYSSWTRSSYWKSCRTPPSTPGFLNWLSLSVSISLSDFSIFSSYCLHNSTFFSSSSLYFFSNSWYYSWLKLLSNFSYNDFTNLHLFYKSILICLLFSSSLTSSNSVILCCLKLCLLSICWSINKFSVFLLFFTSYNLIYNP